RENLKHIAIALQNYQKAYGHLPAAEIRSDDGKPLFIWRVALLPFLGYEKLYQKFHLDEPWDSPHNRPLLNEMPLLYAPDEQGGAVLATPEGVFLIGSGKTFYQGVIRPGTAFDPAKPNGVSF